MKIRNTVMSTALVGAALFAGAGIAQADSCDISVPVRERLAAGCFLPKNGPVADNSSDAGSGEVIPESAGPADRLVFDPGFELDGVRYGGPGDAFVLVPNE
jgi:hypothetical protein